VFCVAMGNKRAVVAPAQNTHFQIDPPGRPRQCLLGSHQRPLDRKAPQFTADLPQTRKDISKFAAEHGIKAVYSMIGHGAHNQIKDITTTMTQLEKVLIEPLNKQWGGVGSWCVLYGGDPYQDDRHDIAALVRELRILGVWVVAIQCAEYSKYMLEDPDSNSGALSTRMDYAHVDAAIIYRTERRRDGKILYGGFDTQTHEHNVVGATRYLLELFGHIPGQASGTQLLKGVICCGGGPISLSEFKEMTRRGYPVFYHPTTVKNPVVDSNLTSGFSEVNLFGIVNEWASFIGLPADVWTACDQNPPQNFELLSSHGDGPDGAATHDRNVVPWVKELASQLVPDENHGLHNWPTTQPLADGFGGRRMVVRRDKVQREIEVAFHIQQVYEISESSSTVGLKFFLMVQVECPPQTPKSAFHFPTFQFSNATAIRFEGEEGWNAQRALEAFDYIEQTDPCMGGVRAFYRLSGQFSGQFLAHLDLEPFPFDTQLFNITLIGGDEETERYTDLQHPAAVLLPDASISAPTWRPLVYRENCNGGKKGDPWCGVQFGLTPYNPATACRHRTVTCTVGMNRRPDSVVINIGAPVFLLTLATMLIYTIPVSDGEMKDERLNVEFIAFLTFITLKIVVMDLLPPLPYSSFIEMYIMYAIGFVAAVAATNSIMLTNIGYDDEEEVRRADRYSMVVSGVLWLFLHAWLLYSYLAYRKRRNVFFNENAIELAPVDSTPLIERKRERGPKKSP